MNCFNRATKKQASTYVHDVHMQATPLTTENISANSNVLNFMEMNGVTYWIPVEGEI